MRTILLSLFLVSAFGCASSSPKTSTAAQGGALACSVTVPNGSSPAKANAPRAPANDSARAGFNHGNHSLWVYLQPGGYTVSDDDVDKDGSLRVKMGWWRGVRGTFSISGRRLDADAPPLRSSIPRPEYYGDFGFIPSLLYFPAEGCWEITGRIDDQSLTFVVRITAKKTTKTGAP